MKKRYNKRVMNTLVWALALLVLPVAVSAQSGVTMSADPSSPEPNSTVTVKLESYSVDLDRSDISWYINDKLEKKGIGEKTLNLKVGTLGSSFRVSASILTTQGTRVSSSLALRPGGVDLLWEADSYTPPFFKGLPLLPTSGVFTVVAFPELAGSNGKIIPASNLIYAWEQDGTPLASGSGYGKQSITLRGSDVPKLKTNVSVTVSSTDGAIVASKNISIPAYTPFVLFYEQRQLEGVQYGKAMKNNYEIRTPSVLVRAEPYYFSLDDYRKGTINYVWSLDGEELPNRQNSHELDLEGSGNQKITIGLRAKNSIRTLQNVTTGVSIVFGGQNRF